MTFCYCCIYGDCVGIGTYKCTHEDGLDIYGSDEKCDVSSCDNYRYDDQIDGDDCYLKEICCEKQCGDFDDD
jgi:hypothetical protein